jgi:hypothetical protein
VAFGPLVVAELVTDGVGVLPFFWTDLDIFTKVKPIVIEGLGKGVWQNKND